MGACVGDLSANNEERAEIAELERLNAQLSEMLERRRRILADLPLKAGGQWKRAGRN